MAHKIVAGIGLMAVGCSVAIVNLTTPSVAGPFGVLVLFFSLYIASACAGYFLLILLHRLVALTGWQWGDRHARAHPLKRYYYASVLGLAPVILLGAYSLGEGYLWINGGLVLAFEVLALTYVRSRF